MGFWMTSQQFLEDDAALRDRLLANNVLLESQSLMLAVYDNDLWVRCACT